MKEARKSGVSLILIGIGIPLILFFFQTSGEFRFLGNVQVFERSLTQAEIKAIKEAIKAEKEGMGAIQKVVEEAKEKYRKRMGIDHFKEKWTVQTKGGFAISYRYFLAFGLILVLIGFGRVIIG
ncbi:MAG: hypothetical protein GTO17_02485 [Candidatus Aminicenantes bacterium]|nr:hypothetical protein [Candidatus Aminicenantes bacterium]